MDVIHSLRYQVTIDRICRLPWPSLSSDEMLGVAWAYSYFSVQFRESLEEARTLHPDDNKLRRLEAEECNTDNLSPWPDVAAAAERMNHDEFMRRTLALQPIDAMSLIRFKAAGATYLAMTRALAPSARAAAIASYEDGGLEAVFKAILAFKDWNTPLLKAFQHFLSEHVRFDSDLEQGHGALSRHIFVDDAVLPLWIAFERLLVTCVPGLELLDAEP